MDPVAAVPYDEFDHKCLTFTSVTPAKDKMDASTKPQYNGVPWAIEFSGMKSFMGIVKTDRYHRFFMNMGFENSADLPKGKLLDDGLVQRMLDCKNQLFPANKAKFMTSTESIQMLYTDKRLFPEGRDKADGTGKYDEQITVDIPMKNPGKPNVSVDTDVLSITNLQGSTIPWNMVAKKPIVSAGVLVDKINLGIVGSGIKVKRTLVYLIVDAPTPICVVPPVRKRVVDSTAEDPATKRVQEVTPSGSSASPVTPATAAASSSSAASSTAASSSSGPADKERKIVTAVNKA